MSTLRLFGTFCSGFVLLLITACSEPGAPAPQSPEPSDTAAKPADPFSDIRADIEELMAAHGVPGLSIAVIDNYEVVWAEGFGNRSVEDDTPVTTRTRFQACSLSKPVTVMGLLTLVDEGRVELDAAANRYLQSWKIPDHEGFSGDSITVRQLLTHSSGLTSGFFPGYPPGSELPPSIPHMLEGKPPTSSAKVVPDFAAGTRWRYSGGGLLVTQLLIEDVTGQPLDVFLQGRVLAPLGMAQSTYASPYPAELLDETALGHGENGLLISGGYREYPSQAVAGLWTTATDLARSMAAIQKTVDGVAPAPAVWQPDTVRQMLAEQDTGTQPVIDDVPTFNVRMGVGYLLEGRNPDTGLTDRFWHWGDNPGYKALQVGTKQGGNGVVILTNSDTGVAITRPIAEKIAEQFGWPLDAGFAHSQARGEVF